VIKTAWRSVRSFPSLSVAFRRFCVAFVAFVAFGVAFCGLPAHAQLNFSSQINAPSDTATLANPVYYTESITALSVTQAGWLPCTIYPTVGVSVLRNGTPMTLSIAELSAGTIVNIPFSFNVLIPGDVVTPVTSLINKNQRTKFANDFERKENNHWGDSEVDGTPAAARTQPPILAR